jgi:protein-tyrosine-phosphatase
MTDWLARIAAVAVTALVGAGGSAHQTSPSAERPPAQTAKPPTVLFMCPRGAAKSVWAAAYFQQIARERGLNVRVDSAGTDPDAMVSAPVADHLKKNGYQLPVAKPRKVNTIDLKTADVVVSIGCDLTNLPPPRGALVRWDDIPALTDDFSRADGAIRKRVIDLIDELMARIKTN